MAALPIPALPGTPAAGAVSHAGCRDLPSLRPEVGALWPKVLGPERCRKEGDLFWISVPPREPQCRTGHSVVSWGHKQASTLVRACCNTLPNAPGAQAGLHSRRSGLPRKEEPLLEGGVREEPAGAAPVPWLVRGTAGAVPRLGELLEVTLGPWLLRWAGEAARSARRPPSSRVGVALCPPSTPCSWGAVCPL